MKVSCTGVLVADIIVSGLERIAGPGELLIVPRRIELHLGGHPSNVSINLRKLGVRRGEVSVIGARGPGLFGDFISRELRRRGVVAHLQVVEDSDTPKNVILVVKGEDRHFHSELGLPPELEYVAGWLERESPSLFYVGGSGILGRFDRELAGILREAKEGGSITFVDPVTPRDGDWRFLKESLPLIDVFHCNEEEAYSFTGAKRMEEAAEILRSGGVSIALISCGERGVYVSTERLEASMPAFHVDAIDPTGAGDAFCSGFIYKVLSMMNGNVSFSSSEDLVDSILYAEAAGGLCVTMVGTTTAVDPRGIDALLSAQRDEVLKGSVIRVH